MGAPRRVVYVSYDGLGDPLGRSQVLPYVEGLAARGHAFDLLSFEKPGTPLRFREPIAPGVRWTALRYHKRPTVPATLFDMLSGLGTASALRFFRDADLVHVRSYVPATLVLPLVRALGLPWLFDMRGFWPDEKVDAGAWPREGRLYRSAKAVERTLLGRATAITVLTNAMRRWLRDDYPHAGEIQAPISVIPTCADLDVFRTDAPRDEALARELAGAKVLSYVGSFGTWYMAKEMAEVYLAWRKRGPSKLLLISRDEPTEVREVLRAHGAEHEIVHRPSKREEVAPRIRCAHAATCFVRPTFSKTGSAPTKLGELLGCGVPVIANVVGDMGTVLDGTPAGVVVDASKPETFDAAAQKLWDLADDPRVGEEARDLAERWFSLERALDGYEAVYDAMGSGRDAAWPR